MQGDILRVENIEFHGAMGHLPVSLNPFSYKFSFGKSYLLDSKSENTAHALSLIIGGFFAPQAGTLYRNGIIYSQKERYQTAWEVRRSEIVKIWFTLQEDHPSKRKYWHKLPPFGFQRQTVKSQIQHGLETIQDQYIQSEAELMERFWLSPERYTRTFRTISNEAWRSSCAIGVAHGKKIFCFPDMYPDFLETFVNIWFKDLIGLVRDSGALVLVPAALTDVTKNLCDEVILIDR